RHIRAPRVGERGLYRGDDRRRPQDHPGAAAVRRVVDGAVAVGGLVADVVQDDLDQAPVDGAPDDALAEGAGEHAGEEGQDIPAHRWPSPCLSTLTPSGHVGRNIGAPAAVPAESLPHDVDARNPLAAPGAPAAVPAGWLPPAGTLPLRPAVGVRLAPR